MDSDTESLINEKEEFDRNSCDSDSNKEIDYPSSEDSSSDDSEGNDEVEFEESGFGSEIDEEVDEKFQEDVNLHGLQYAKWKRQMLKDMGDQGEDNDLQN